MADTKISAATAATTLGATDQLPIAVGGASKSITGTNLFKSTRAASRLDRKSAAEGFITESFPRAAWISASTNLATQQMECAGVYLFAGETVTTIIWSQATAGTSVTVGRVGLYDTSGNLLASCANDTTIWTASANLRQKNVSTPFPIVTDGYYYIALLAVFTGTAPQVLRGTSQTGASVVIGAGNAPATRQTGLSDLPNPATLATGTGVFWMAVA